MDIAETRRAQQQEALAKARVVRSQRGELRKSLKANKLDAFKVIEGTLDPRIEEIVGPMRLREILPMVPGIGKPRTLEIIMAFNASTETRLKTLSPERRKELAWITKGAREAYVMP